MKKQETAKEINRREKRIARRETRNGISAKRKKRRGEIAEWQEETLEAINVALKKDKQQNKPEDKRPGAEKFLSAFSYIKRTPYDKREHIPQGYRCRSFNEQRQYFDFFKEFIYPYKISPVLILAALENETIKTDNGKIEKYPDAWIIQLAKKWVNDIVSGNSFYKRNKDCFTKAEAHFFLNSEIAYNELGSVIESALYAKCMARKISVKRSRAIAAIFTRKFSKHWNHPIVAGFLDLIARSPDFAIEHSGLDDICDYILNEIEQHGKERGGIPLFSFSGRTMASVTALANEWHADVLREQEAQDALARAGRTVNRNTGQARIQKTIRWNGIDIQCSRIEDDECAWSFTQLCDVQGLLNEGRLMKNCVSSYSFKCASGAAAIFHASRIFKYDQVYQEIATIEVTKNRVLVQAKGKCNAKLTPAVMSVIKKWAQLNRMKVCI